MKNPASAGPFLMTANHVFVGLVCLPLPNSNAEVFSGKPFMHRSYFFSILKALAKTSWSVL